MSVLAESFPGADDTAKIQAAIDYAAANKDKTVTLSDRDYRITRTILLKEGVKLKGGYGSRLIIAANIRVLELHRGASLQSVYIAIDSTAFNQTVLYLDGRHRYYNSWNRTVVRDVNIVNWTGTHKGKGVHLYSGGSGHEISFVNFENLKMAGLGTAVHLQAVKPAAGGYAWVNANRFRDLTIDDCVQAVLISGNETIPNECSGNQFTAMQIQVTPATARLFTVSGQFNEFDGVAWDLGTSFVTGPLVDFTPLSSYNTFRFRSIASERIRDRGSQNKTS